MKRLQPRVYISTYFRGQNERCAYLPTHVSAMPTYAYPVPTCVFCPICQRPNLMNATPCDVRVNVDVR